MFIQKNKNINVLINDISNITNKRKINLNKTKNNLSSKDKNILKGSRVLTWERKSIEVKPQKKEKTNNISKINVKLEKISFNNNYLLKKNSKILSTRPNSLLNKKNSSNLTKKNNSINILKKTQSKKMEYYSNKLTFSNPNLM